MTAGPALQLATLPAKTYRPKPRVEPTPGGDQVNELVDKFTLGCRSEHSIRNSPRVVKSMRSRHRCKFVSVLVSKGFFRLRALKKHLKGLIWFCWLFSCSCCLRFCSMIPTLEPTPVWVPSGNVELSICFIGVLSLLSIVANILARSCKSFWSLLVPSSGEWMITQPLEIIESWCRYLFSASRSPDRLTSQTSDNS